MAPIPEARGEGQLNIVLGKPSLTGPDGGIGMRLQPDGPAARRFTDVADRPQRVPGSRRKADQLSAVK
jgi:hypothetical protein